MANNDGHDERPGRQRAQLGPATSRRSTRTDLHDDGDDGEQNTTRDRSRSPRRPAYPVHGRHIDCPQLAHCTHCITAGDYIAGIEGDTDAGCCGSAYCYTGDPEWVPTVLKRPDGATAKQWRFAAYKAAFRIIHGIGQRNVRIPHHTCVVHSIKSHIEQHHQEEASAESNSSAEKT